MSNSYNPQSWGQSQPTYRQPGLQLEHEFDFSAIGTSDDLQRQSQPAFPDSYHPPSYQLPTGSIAPSSMVRSTFPATQPQSGSFGVTNGVTKAESPGFVPVPYGSNQNRNQNSGSFDSMYNNNQTSPDQHLGWNDPSSYNYQNQIPNNNSTYSGSGYNDDNHGITTTHLSSSPTPMQNSFPRAPPSTPYYPIATTSRTADPRVKRAHSQIQDDGKDEDADMAADAKDAAKARP
jgi:hypothetical protein